MTTHSSSGSKVDVEDEYSKSRESHPYGCTLELQLRDGAQAAQVQQIMQVDREVGDRVVKRLRIEASRPETLIV